MVIVHILHISTISKVKITFKLKIYYVHDNIFNKLFYLNEDILRV